MTARPHLRMHGAHWLCSLPWLPGVTGVGASPLEAYTSWKWVYFATPAHEIIRARRSPDAAQGEAG